MADPFAGSRDNFAQLLVQDWNRLTSTDPAQVLKDPQFQFLKEQGLGAIGAASAASGSYNSGTRGIKGAELQLDLLRSS